MYQRRRRQRPQRSLWATHGSHGQLNSTSGEGNVPGQDPSWIYEDSTAYRYAIIDGEKANAQWAVIKAGKRRRLAENQSVPNARILAGDAGPQQRRQ